MNSTQYDLSIVIPAYNEEFRLLETLKKIDKFLKSFAHTAELIVVDDGSKDKTADLVSSFSRENTSTAINLIKLAKNSGKGAAVKAGVFAALGAYILIYDADGATPIEELLRLWPQRKDYALLLGSRALYAPDVSLQAELHRKSLGRLFNFAVNILLIPKIRDTQCGFKLIEKKAARYLFSLMKQERFSFDVELIFLAERSGLTIREIPVNWHNVPGSKVNVIKDGLAMFADLFKIRLQHSSISSRNYQDFAAKNA